MTENIKEQLADEAGLIICGKKDGELELIGDDNAWERYECLLDNYNAMAMPF